MVATILIKDKKAFKKFLAESKDNEYFRYFIKKPEKYPCIAIMESAEHGDMGTDYFVATYVYPEHFDTERNLNT